MASEANMAEINDMANGNAEPVSVASAPFMMAADVSRLREMTPGGGRYSTNRYPTLLHRR